MQSEKIIGGILADLLREDYDTTAAIVIISNRDTARELSDFLPTHISDVGLKDVFAWLETSGQRKGDA
jgi:hypothetical protein